MGRRPDDGVKRPAQARVGYATYSIDFVENGDWRDGDNLGGVSEHETHAIRIRVTPDRHEDSMRETLLHELMHAVWCKLGLNHFPVPKHKDDIEEYLVNAQAPALLQLLNDNPDVVAYLLNVSEAN